MKALDVDKSYAQLPSAVLVAQVHKVSKCEQNEQTWNFSRSNLTFSKLYKDMLFYF